MTSITDSAIRELAIITTRNEAGQHWTEWSRHWRDLEEAGLIEVHRPVHPDTGLQYAEEYWTLTVTDDGMDVVDTNPELWPD